MAIMEIQKLKVGKYVKLYLHDFFSRKEIPNELLANLQDKEYSKEMIGLNYPLLIRINQGDDNKEKVVFSGSSRYWTDKMVRINGEDYYICNDCMRAKQEIIVLHSINGLTKSKIDYKTNNS